MEKHSITHAFISGGRLFVRTETGEVKEIESTFINEKLTRSRHHQTYSGWKSNHDPNNPFMTSQTIWGGQAESNPMFAFAFKDFAIKDEHTIYYLLQNNRVTGLFGYNMAEETETRFFHKNDFVESGFDYSPARGEFVIAVCHPEGECSLRLLNSDGGLKKELSVSDVRISRPCFSKDGTHILFQAAPIYRDEAGFISSVGQDSIWRINPDTEEVSEITNDYRYEYLLGREDIAGNIYCIRRPYKLNQHGAMANLKFVLNILLFPVYFVIAIFKFISTFTALMNRDAMQPLGPQAQKSQGDRYVRILGQAINLSKLQKKSELGKEVSLVPKNWELIRLSPNGSIEILANNVASYDIDQNGNVTYTNGFKVIGPPEKTEHFKFSVIESLRARQNHPAPITTA
jgi:hypothetical protein